MPETAEVTQPDEVTEDAVSPSEVELRNSKKTLYCVGCCNKVRFNWRNGKWESPSGSSHNAEVVNNEFVQCSCGQVMGVIYHHGIFLPGEVIPTTGSA